MFSRLAQSSINAMF
ncbi:hypothetical protein [Shigella boydii]|nr:hypothetical protein [Shigella boydii]EHX1737910.1 hypothetical protein [Shigella boydii]